MNLIAAWKELLVATVLFWAVINRFRGKVGKFSINLNPVDKIIAIYFAYNLLYIILSFTVFKYGNPASILNGFRMQSFFAIVYFTSKIANSGQDTNPLPLAKNIIYAGTIVSVLAIIELFYNPSGILQWMGMKDYLIEVGGMKPIEFARDGLVGSYYSTYTTNEGSVVRFRRCGSTLLNPLVYGQILIVTIPLGLSLFLKNKLKITHIIIQSIGLVCSLSRGPIAAVIISIFSFLTILKLKYKTKIIFIVIISILSVIIAIKSSEFLYATISLRDASAANRAVIWANSVRFILEHPFGVGHAASERKFTDGIRIGGGESELFENISRIGWIGGGVYLMMFFLILKHTKRFSKISRNGYPEWLSGAIFAITIGIFFQQIINRVWNSPFIPFIYGWLLGIWSASYCKCRENKINLELDLRTKICK